MFLIASNTVCFVLVLHFKQEKKDLNIQHYLLQKLQVMSLIGQNF